MVVDSSEFAIFGDTRTGEPCFEHGVDGLGSFLLDPMRNSGEHAEGQVRDVRLSSLRGAEIEGDIGVAPNK